MPILAGCSSSDMSGFWFDRGSQTRSSSSEMPVETPLGERAALNRAACGLFFNQDPVRDPASNSASSTDIQPISLDASPQDNLLQAISYDMDGNYDNARKLYVWLTASSPDLKIDLDCGQGIRLSGSVTSLAQRRLVALDISKPQFARSAEIETVIASATVAPGPELPNPPKVERNRDFYQQGGAVIAEPEDRTSPAPRMDMAVSENTARLTSVERRIAEPSDAARAGAQEKPVATAPVTAPAVMAPSPSVNAQAKAKAPAQPVNSASPDAMSAPTIAGAQEETMHTGAVVETNSHPDEQGQLEIVDDAPVSATPAENMIEVPMAPKPAPATQTPRQTATIAPSSPYYAVQLAAYRSRERAEAAWLTFQSRSNGILSNAAHDVTTIAIDGQGLFFRLMTGQYTAKSEALQACNVLKNQGVDCLIRRVTP